MSISFIQSSSFPGQNYIRYEVRRTEAVELWMIVERKGARRSEKQKVIFQIKKRREDQKQCQDTYKIMVGS